MTAEITLTRFLLAPSLFSITAAISLGTYHFSSREREDSLMTPRELRRGLRKKKKKKSNVRQEIAAIRAETSR